MFTRKHMNLGYAIANNIEVTQVEELWKRALMGDTG